MLKTFVLFLCAGLLVAIVCVVPNISDDTLQNFSRSIDLSVASGR